MYLKFLCFRIYFEYDESTVLKYFCFFFYKYNLFSLGRNENITFLLFQRTEHTNMIIFITIIFTYYF